MYRQDPYFTVSKIKEEIRKKNILAKLLSKIQPRHCEIYEPWKKSDKNIYKRKDIYRSHI